MALPLPTRINGQTIDQTWFNLANDELVALDGRVQALTTDSKLVFGIHGFLENLYTDYPLAEYLLTQDWTINGATSWIENNGSAGALTLDLKFKRGAADWVSVFQTKPSIPYGAGDAADSDTGAGATAAIINSTYDELLAGDRLGLFMVAVPSAGDPENFRIELDRTITGSVV